VQFATERRSAASPDVLFARLAAGDRWSEWAGLFVPRSRWQAPGNPVGGVGAVRRLGFAPLVSLERIVEHEPNRRLAYVVDSWAPFRDYRAVVDLTPLPDGGTQILWSATFEPRLPGTGRLLRWALSGIVDSFARNLAKTGS
jgi:hypothetical protein